jgi:hypothetical protein
MIGACTTCGGTREVQIEIWWENLKERDRLEDLGIDGRIIFK